MNDPPPCLLYRRIRDHTNVGASNVEDASLTDEWDKGKRVVADVKQAIFDLSESRAKDLLKMKGPAFGKKTSENFT